MTKIQARRRPGGAKARASKPPQRWALWAAAGVAVAAIAAVVLTIALRNDGTGTAHTAAGTASELSQIKTNDFHSMAISPAEGGATILYGHHGGVLRSTDGGRTWAQTSLTAPNDDAMGMGISGGDPQTVFAAGHSTFFKSTDGGKTWKSMRPNLPGLDLHGMAVAPDQGGRLYANVVGFGLYRSDDAGSNWTKANTQPFPTDVIQVSASAGGVVFVASVGGGVLRSDDAGATFRKTGTLRGAVLTVAASATDGNVVYAGTESGFFSSRDGGVTWTERTPEGGGQAMVSAANPNDPADVIVVLVRDDRAGHVFRSRDGGATWGGG